MLDTIQDDPGSPPRDFSTRPIGKVHNPSHQYIRGIPLGGISLIRIAGRGTSRCRVGQGSSMDIIEESARIIREEGACTFLRRAVLRLARNTRAVVTWAGDELDPHTRFRMSDLEKGLRDSPSANERLSGDAVMRIIHAYLAAKKDQPDQPAPYQVTGDWALIAGDHHRSMIESLEHQDPDALKQLLNNFAREPISRGLHLSGTFPTTFMARVYLLKAMNRSYRAWKRMTSLPDEVLEYEKSIGNMHGMDSNGRSIMLPAFNQSYFAQRILELLGATRSRVLIVEIGGGYGSLPYHLFKNPGFSGSYQYLDIPEMCVIASYFLMSHFPEKKFLLYGEGDPSSRRPDAPDISILPNFCLKELPDRSVDLVFNSHGMSQMNPATIREYLEQIDRTCLRYFLHANTEDEAASLARDVNYLNLNRPEFELPRDRWLRIYRFPELIRNDGIINPEFSSWEYLYERLGS
jgi:putative sugar O-methyltransferase